MTRMCSTHLKRAREVCDYMFIYYTQICYWLGNSDKPIIVAHYYLLCVHNALKTGVVCASKHTKCAEFFDLVMSFLVHDICNHRLLTRRR